MNTDMQSDGSEGQNLKQDHSLSPCYQLMGSDEVPLTQARVGKLIHKASLVYFPLCFPFLSYHRSTHTALFNLLVLHNIFSTITLHAPPTHCTLHLASLKYHACTLTENELTHSASDHSNLFINSEAHFICSWLHCKDLQPNNKYANMGTVFCKVNSIKASMAACLNIHSSAIPFDSQSTAEAGRSVRELDVMHVRMRQDTALSTQLGCSGTHWLHSVGSKEVKEHIRQSHFPQLAKHTDWRCLNSLTDLESDWKAWGSFMLKSLGEDMHTKSLWEIVPTLTN